MACEDGSRQASSPEPGRRSGAAVVASFNFPESELLAEIYAAALEHAGIPVERELNLGPRELVGPALRQGFVDVLPEYLGTALAAASPEDHARTHDPTTAALALSQVLAIDGVRVLRPSPAQNQNAVVVTRRTANRLKLVNVSDLLGHGRKLMLGGPPECPSRQFCMRGLLEVYGLAFEGFVPLEGATRTRRALEEGVVDVGIMFTTDGHLATRDLVALNDDRHLQPPENVVPVVREEALAHHGDRLRAAVDAVSARLTTTAVRLLNWRVSVAGREPRAEARAWLTRQGMLPRNAPLEPRLPLSRGAPR